MISVRGQNLSFFNGSEKSDMSISCLSSLCACYAEIASSETMTDKNITTNNFSNNNMTENTSDIVLDVNGNPVPVPQKTTNNKRAVTGFTRTTSSNKSSVELIGKDKIQVQNKELSDENDNPAAPVSQNSVHIGTHNNSFTQTHWNLCTQTPRISVFSGEQEQTPETTEKGSTVDVTNAQQRSFTTLLPKISWVWKGHGVASEDVYIAGNSIYTFDSFGSKLEWKGGNRHCKIGKFQLRTRQEKESGKVVYSIGIECQYFDKHVCKVVQEDSKTIMARAKKNSQEMQLRFLIRNKRDDTVITIESADSSEPDGSVAWISITNVA